MSLFKKAHRAQSRLRIALFGPSGSGKTLSALVLAASIAKFEAERRGEKGCGKVAVIDTENGRASLYVGHESLPPGFVFDTVRIKAPFTPERYVKYIEGAALEKYDVVVVDSVSHAWAGKGGMLDQKDQASGNNFTAWRKVSKQHQRLVDALVQTDVHMVATCRTKTAYEMVDDQTTGKKSVKKIGTAPVFREGLEYEFVLCWELDMDHVANPTKDNTSMFDTPDGKICEIISNMHGSRMIKWLYDHAPSEEDEELFAEANAAEEEEVEEIDADGETSEEVEEVLPVKSRKAKSAPTGDSIF